MALYNSTIVVFSALAYDNLLRGRPWAITHELTRRNYKVIFVAPPVSFLRYISDKKRYASYKKGYAKELLNYFFKRVTYRGNLISVNHIPILPFGGYFKVIRIINRLLLNLEFISVFKNIGVNIKNSICIVGEPWWYNLLKDWKLKTICYDCIDDIKVFLGVRKYELYKKWHIGLIKGANIIFASSIPIKNEILSINPNATVVYIPNGVDVSWFRQQAYNSKSPSDLSHIPTPIIGFVGLISFWIDVKLIYEAAAQLPAYSFVLVGPTCQRLGQPPSNLYILGPKPYSEIPSYIKSFDVCLAPFKVDKIGDAADPLKIYEYLALGKPIVSTNIAEIKKLREYIYIARDKKEFIELINEALKESKELNQKRELYAENNSWAKRVDEILSSISKVI